MKVVLTKKVHCTKSNKSSKLDTKFLAIKDIILGIITLCTLVGD